MLLRDLVSLQERVTELERKMRAETATSDLPSIFVDATAGNDPVGR